MITGCRRAREGRRRKKGRTSRTTRRTTNLAELEEIAFESFLFLERKVETRSIDGGGDRSMGEGKICRAGKKSFAKRRERGALRAMTL